MQIQPGPSQQAFPAPLRQKQDGSEVFCLEKRCDDRINGSIPVWKEAETAEEKLSADLSKAANSSASPPENANSLAETGEAETSSFGFFDLIDMVNPLQHIPVIGSVYRKITGDEIKPVSRIIGGAAFGGPLGAASGMVNAVAQWGTGKDLTSNILSDPARAGASSSPDTTIALANLAADQSRYNS